MKSSHLRHARANTNYQLEEGSIVCMNVRTVDSVRVVVVQHKNISIGCYVRVLSFESIPRTVATRTVATSTRYNNELNNDTVDLFHVVVN